MAKPRDPILRTLRDAEDALASKPPEPYRWDHIHPNLQGALKHIVEAMKMLHEEQKGLKRAFKTRFRSTLKDGP